MKNFWIRTLSATVYALLFVGSIYSGRMLDSGVWGLVIFSLFALTITIGCTYEFYRMVRMQGARPTTVLGYALSVLTVLFFCIFTTWSCYMTTGVFEVGLGWMLMCLFLLLLIAVPMTLILQLWHPSEQPFRDAAYTILPALYFAIPLGIMVLMNSHFGEGIVIMLLIMIWINDSGAYMGGSLVGKHKMWPRHSPGKTWEGTFIGFVCCLLAAIFIGPIFEFQINIEMRLFIWIGLAVIVTVIGTLGDLVESMLKRSVGVKDSGNIMPGHGGFLDRFDSILTIMPVALGFLLLYLEF